MSGQELRLHFSLQSAPSSPQCAIGGGGTFNHEYRVLGSLLQPIVTGLSEGISLETPHRVLARLEALRLFAGPSGSVQALAHYEQRVLLYNWAAFKATTQRSIRAAADDLVKKDKDRKREREEKERSETAQFHTLQKAYGKGGKGRPWSQQYHSQQYRPYPSTSYSTNPRDAEGSSASPAAQGKGQKGNTRSGT